MIMADVFRSRLFETTELTAAINESETPPQRLAELGIFNEQGVRTTSVIIEKQGNTLELVPSKPRGADPTPMHQPKRTGITLTIPHFPARDTLMADEIQGVRAFGSTDELQSIEQVRDQKIANINASLDNTEEYLRLGAIAGLVKDADGSTLFDLFDEFGVDEPDTFFFDLGAAWAATDGGVVRAKALEVKEAIRVALGNKRVTGVHALCGSTFYSSIANHPEVIATYMNQQAANALRESEGNETFRYGGITWELYPGYGDVEIADDKCRFIPLGVPDLFISRFAPAPWIDTVNTVGLPRYAMANPDSTARKYIEIEGQTNALHICTRPDVLFQGDKDAS